MREITITENEANQRIDRFIGKYLNKADKTYINKMIRKKNIKINGKKIKGNERILLDDKVQIYLAEDTIEKFRNEKEFKETSMKIDIIYEDDNLILINKPSGIITHSDEKEGLTLLDVMLNNIEYNESVSFRPSFANRLDKNTSGIIIGCKNYDFLKEINKLIKERKIKKYYKTIIAGRIDKEIILKDYAKKNCQNNVVTVSSSEREGYKEINTIIKPIQYNEYYSEVEIQILTGFSHQIRTHLSSIGHPIIGDVKYGGEKKMINYQLLHSWKLIFEGLDDKYKYLNNQEFKVEEPEVYKKIKNSIFKQ